ncbi:MAG: hypothetical protein ACI31F_02935 [Muribaculaceae bacterium]
MKENEFSQFELSELESLEIVGGASSSDGIQDRCINAAAGCGVGVNQISCVNAVVGCGVDIFEQAKCL